MQNFIVLGIIPGTNIQTGLNFWLTVTVLLTLVVFRRHFVAFRNFLQRQMVAHSIARAIDAYELAAGF